MTTTELAPDLFLIKVTETEALVLRLGLAAAAPHMTPAERLTALILERRLAEAAPFRTTP